MKRFLNLGFFLLPSPARTIPLPLVLLAKLPSPALTIPFPTVNKLPNIFKNPPFCSLVSFLIVLLTPFNKIPEIF